jgi:hypothetical protein
VDGMALLSREDLAVNYLNGGEISERRNLTCIKALPGVTMENRYGVKAGKDIPYITTIGLNCVLFSSFR